MTQARRLACNSAMIAALLLLFAPLWLGPAMGSLARVLGGVHHVCACGMTMGKCGCPACARLERERAHGASSAPCPIVKATCDDDGAALPSPPLPPCVPPNAFSLVADTPDGRWLAPRPAAPSSLAGEGPPTPPPRSRLL